MSDPETNTTPLFISRSHCTTEANKTGAWRFLRPRYDEKTAPCSVACPAGEDVGRIQMLASQGLFKEAWETILHENPFPGVCGRICHHPCESVCNRGRFDEPVAIHVIERFVADTASRYQLQPALDRLPSRKQRVALAGAGPSGLAAAHFLARLGYGCDVFESASEPGGLLRYGVPPYRLPVGVVRSEIARIEELGVRIFCEKPWGEEFLQRAGSTYDAVFLGCGLARSCLLNVPGHDLPGVLDGLELLRTVVAGQAPAVEGVNAVIGGGYAAIETARSIVRLGGKALLIYLRRRGDAPAFKDGVRMALEEGVEVQQLKTPVRIESEAGEYLLTLQGIKAADGEDAEVAPAPPAGEKPETIRVSRVFTAVGFDPAEPWMAPPETGEGILPLNNTVLLTTASGLPMVFGGDLANTAKSVVHAVASGKEAAIALDLLFREGIDAIRPGLERCAVGNGRSLSMEAHMNGPRALRSSAVVRYSDINTDHFCFAPALVQPRLLKAERVRSFSEIDLKISANVAMREADRCFNCGLCNQCDNCRLFCPDMAVVRDETAGGRSIDYDYCKGCGICVVECPRHAMSLEEEQGSEQ